MDAIKKIYLALITVVSFIVVVFINSFIPISYDIIDRQKTDIDIEKRLETLNEHLTSCNKEETPRLVAECQYPIRNEIKVLEFKQKSRTFDVGPITYYYTGGEVEVSEHGMAVFNLKMLAENTGSSDVALIHCSGAYSCNYYVWDGNARFIFSSHNFAAGNIGINPGQARFFNIVFGPAQGYGNYVDFEYYPSKEYFLLIDEPFGSAQVPLNLVSNDT